MGQIYVVINTSNGMCYIGQTNFSIESRRVLHEKSAKGGLTDCPLFYNALRKYGFDSFIWDIVFDGVKNQNDLNRLEMETIKEYNTLAPNGYNLQLGGLGGRHSEVSKRKMGLSRQGIKFSREHKENLSKARRRRVIGPMPLEVKMKISASKKGKTYEEVYGIQKAVELRKERRKSALGRKHTKETKQKIRQINLGKKLSEETKAKIGNSTRGKKKNPYTEEARRNMSEAAKKRCARMPQEEINEKMEKMRESRKSNNNDLKST